MLNQYSWESACRLNQLLNDRSSLLPSPEMRRELINARSPIFRMNLLDAELITALTRGLPVVAVDGSRADFGASYPYIITIMQALAKPTHCPDGVPSHLSNGQVISPLEQNTEKEINDWVQKDRRGEDESYRRLTRDQLAALELDLAVKSIKEYDPALLLLDGGFLLFDTQPRWQELEQAARATGCLVVGVVEEIATSELAEMSGINTGGIRVYDREFLFGILEPGEAFCLKGENAIKRDYATVFARMATALQATACDFFSFQADMIPQCMDLIYSLTPRQGRGIPAWLDMVDREVRLEIKNTEKVLATALDAPIIERYLKSNRSRRGL